MSLFSMTSPCLDMFLDLESWFVADQMTELQVDPTDVGEVLAPEQAPPQEVPGLAPMPGPGQQGSECGVVAGGAPTVQRDEVPSQARDDAVRHGLIEVDGQVGHLDRVDEVALDRRRVGARTRVDGLWAMQQQIDQVPVVP